MINILAIESSCDDTSAAVISDGTVKSNIIANQDVHKSYGGVVPELASREHLMHIIPVVDQALSAAQVSKKELSAIAFTKGPGLLGSLIVGVSFAKSMALSLDIPLIDVHHMHAHVLAHFAEKPHPSFPFICLTVSGGHTQLVLVRDFDDMEIIGTTIDDAAGEAFDKTGKILGLDYPAGPIIDKLAKLGNPVYTFSKPRIDKHDFSFSGLKTSILYFLQKEMKQDATFIERNMNDICASVQTTIVDILLSKLHAAAIELNISRVAIAGGVSANSGLRQGLVNMGIKNDWETYIPKFEYCTDNAAMIGVTGYYKYLKGVFSNQEVYPMARLEF
jgi:N6-L-threonylcarbamoyladenine synthase